MEIIFNCNAQAIDKEMSSTEMTQLYQQALADGKQIGYTPIIVFVDDTLKETIELHFDRAKSRKAYIH